MKPQAYLPVRERRKHTWHSLESQYRKRTLFSGWMVAGLGMSLGAVLMLVYPRESLERRLANTYRSNHPDQLAINYLEAFLKADPNSTPLRLNLTRQLTRMGSFRSAREILAPLRESYNPQWVDEAAWLDLEILVQEAFSIKDNVALKQEKLDRVQAQLRHLLTLPQSPERLLEISRRALAIGAYSVAKQAYKRLVADAPPLQSAEYAKVALAALQLQDYETAADLYFLAMRDSAEKKERRDYYFQALKTLQSGTLYDEAIKAADQHIGLLVDDGETLLFLIDLAKACNKPEAAKRYAKRMFHLSSLERWRSLGQIELASYSYGKRRDASIALHSLYRVAEETAKEPAQSQQGSGTKAITDLPYDQRTYETAFSTFLANQDTASARLVAEAAVRQRPKDPVWRRRLAEVSEWSNQPRAALPQWVEYARLSGDEFGWDAVLRLAEGLNEHEALMTALQHKLSTEPGNATLLLKLAQLKLSNGDTGAAIDLLRNRLLSGKAAVSDRKARREALELLVATAEKAGRRADAAAALQQWQREFGPSSAVALRIANLYYQLGKMPEAFAALEAAENTAPENDVNFWRTYAQLAQLNRNETAVIRAYRHLLSAEALKEDELFALVNLLQKDYPLAAARAAQFGFAKTGNVRFAQDALALMIRAGDWESAHAFLEHVPPAALAKMEQEPGFLSLRASIAQANGRIKDAVRDLEAALQKHPENMELRASLIWALIATRDTETLKRALRSWSREAEDEQVLWGPFAAANMSLNRPATALHWYRKRGFPRDDYLWLLSYAEALDATSQPDLAWRIRRRAWNELRRPEVLAQATSDELTQMRNRFAGMAPLFMNGDDARRVIQALLRADMNKLARPMAQQTPQNGAQLLEDLSRLMQQQTSPTSQAPSGAQDITMASLLAPTTEQRYTDDARLSAGAREVALAYAMSREQYELARTWLATQYAGELAKPVWAELSLALAAEDKPALNRMLDEMPDWMPALDRIEAAQRTGHIGLAESLAFEQMEQLPDNEQLHSRLTQLATAHTPTAEVDARHFRQSPLDGNKYTVRLGTRVNENTDVIAQIIEQKLSTSDPNQLPHVPANDREYWLIARRRLDTGYVAAGVMHRDADASNNGAQVEAQFAGPSKTTVTAVAGWNQPAVESALLRAGGQRSGAQVSVNYAFTRTEYGRATLGWQRYESQAGTVLGHGTNWIIEAGSNLRTDYPNITARAYVSGISTTSSGRFDQQIARLAPVGVDPANFDFVPAGDTVYGFSIGAGTFIDGTYTRAWRPFAEAGTTYSRVAGTGFNGIVGLAGSVFGNDVLRLRLQHISGTAANPNGFTEIGANYKWYF